MTQTFGITGSGKPCKRCEKQGDFCTQHADQRPDPAPSVPITGGTSPAVQELQQQTQARLAGGPRVPLTEQVDALAYLREIATGIRTVSEELSAFKGRVEEVEERQQQREAMMDAWHEKMERLADAYAPEEKERAAQRARQREEELVRGGTLVERVRDRSATEEILGAPRKPIQWVGDWQIFGIKDVRILIRAGNNDPCVLMNKAGTSFKGMLEGGVPAHFWPVLRESEHYREIAEERDAILRIDDIAMRNQEANRLVQRMAELDHRHNLVTNKDKDIAAMLAAHPR